MEISVREMLRDVFPANRRKIMKRTLYLSLGAIKMYGREGGGLNIYVVRYSVYTVQYNKYW